jgi:endonuclease/exonuclease/phosphatase (EEP) superfamily protein YafD
MTTDVPPPQSTPRLVWLSWVYAGALVVLLAVRFGVGDSSPWPFALNAFLLYGFVPLPLVLIAGILNGRRDLVLIVAFAAAVWLYLWGGLFVPRAPPAASGSSLIVFSYNVFGYNFDAAEVIRVIEDSGADVVSLNELNMENAAAIERELKPLYPYQWLVPKPGVTGSGFLSRHRFERGEPLPLGSHGWVGAPMAIELVVGQRRVTIVGFHASAGPDRVAKREQQARALADYADRHSGALVLLGDLNATDQNSAYAVVTDKARDAWREAGRGFGHTFPSTVLAAPRGARAASLLTSVVPPWLVRIDYVFYSEQLEAIDARLSESGGSDHRGVIATLVLK